MLDGESVPAPPVARSSGLARMDNVNLMISHQNKL